MGSGSPWLGTGSRGPTSTRAGRVADRDLRQVLDAVVFVCATGQLSRPAPGASGPRAFVGRASTPGAGTGTPSRGQAGRRCRDGRDRRSSSCPRSPARSRATTSSSARRGGWPPSRPPYSGSSAPEPPLFPRSWLRALAPYRTFERSRGRLAEARARSASSSAGLRRLEGGRRAPSCAAGPRRPATDGLQAGRGLRRLVPDAPASPRRGGGRPIAGVGPDRIVTADGVGRAVDAISSRRASRRPTSSRRWSRRAPAGATSTRPGATAPRPISA